MPQCGPKIFVADRREGSSEIEEDQGGIAPFCGGFEEIPINVNDIFDNLSSFHESSLGFANYLGHFPGKFVSHCTCNNAVETSHNRQWSEVPGRVDVAPNRFHVMRFVLAAVLAMLY